MQMRKKILATALVATMVFGLVGCGSGSGDSSQASNSGSGSSAKTQTEEFNPDTVEDSMTIEEIRQNLGDEVKVKGGLQLGAIAKSFSNEFWRNFKNGYEAAEKSLKDAGVDVKIKVDGTTDESDEIGQQTMTDNLVNQGYNALMLSPISDSNLTSSVDNAKTKKIPTINVNDGLISAADYFVGPDAYQNGELAAEWVSKQLGDKGEVAIVVGMAKAFAARERTAGFKGWIKDNNSGLKVVAEQNADWDRQKAKELASNLNSAAENMHFKDSGAYTGEVSVEMLKEIGVEWVILGHSERRQYFGETDETVNAKMLQVLKNDMTPIVCVGETLEQYEAGTTKDVVKTQVVAAYKDVCPKCAARSVIAYEPVWAIGTGKTATNEIAQDVCGYIRSVVAELYGQEVADQVRIQYGGSVKPEGLKALLEQPDIDGALVGGASLVEDSYKAMIAALD